MEFTFNTRRLLSYTRRAVDDYNMIEDGDKIAIGLSGGKDSIALVCAMANLRYFYPKKFELEVITMDPGFYKAGFGCEEETKKGMDGSQVTGASSSYARKYALNGLFDIDDTKDSDSTNTHGKEETET